MLEFCVPFNCVTNRWSEGPFYKTLLHPLSLETLDFWLRIVPRALSKMTMAYSYMADVFAFSLRFFNPACFISPSYITVRSLLYLSLNSSLCPKQMSQVIGLYQVFYCESLFEITAEGTAGVCVTSTAILSTLHIFPAIF